MIKKNVLPTDPTNEVRLMIYNNKFKTTNLIISHNSSYPTEILDRINVVYMFKCPFGEYVSKK